MTARAKVEIDIELLLRWAYVDELSKRQSSAAEGIWDRIQDYQNHGGIDSGQGAAQRYAHFGLPDPDAERIELAVSAMADTVIDWGRNFKLIAGDLAGLIEINALIPHKVSAHQSGRAGWGEAGTKALKAMFSKDPKAAVPPRERPRDVLLVGGIKTRVLLTMHAIKGTRPDAWQEDGPKPSMIMASRGTGPSIVGECRGRNLYSTGSYCPLEWSPSPLSIVQSRADYFAWHDGLTKLANSLQLERFTALPPKAPAAPWFDASEDVSISRIVPVVPNGYNDVAEWGTLPLKPPREKARAPISLHDRETPGILSGSIMRGLRVGGESLT